MGGDRAQRMALAFVNPSRAHAVAKKTGETVKKACRCNRKGPNEQFRLGRSMERRATRIIVCQPERLNLLHAVPLQSCRKLDVHRIPSVR